jgi:hypothetical protein
MAGTSLPITTTATGAVNPLMPSATAPGWSNGDAEHEPADQRWNPWTDKGADLGIVSMRTRTADRVPWRCEQIQFFDGRRVHTGRAWFQFMTDGELDGVPGVSGSMPDWDACLTSDYLTPARASLDQIEQVMHRWDTFADCDTAIYSPDVDDEA